MSNINSPVISIITVVYNAIDTLEHTLKSVINQTYPNIQYIIIDGSSTDGSIDVINKYISKISVFVSEPDNGIYDAMNKGLDKATGDWVYFLGSDDLLLTPTTIEEVVCRFKSEGKVYYGDTYLKNNNRMYEGKVSKAKLLLCNISHQAIFYPRSIFKEKRYNTRYRYFADHVYNLELYALSPDDFAYMPQLISVYNDQGRSSTFQDELYAQDIIRITAENYGVIAASYVWVRRKVSKLKKTIIN